MAVTPVDSGDPADAVHDYVMPRQSLRGHGRGEGSYRRAVDVGAARVG